MRDGGVHDVVFSSIIKTVIDSVYLMIRNQGAMGMFLREEESGRRALVSEDERKPIRQKEVDCLVRMNKWAE